MSPSVPVEDEVEVEVEEAIRCLSGVVPLEAIQAAVAKAGKQDERLRKLPAVLVTQLVIALGLIADTASRQVLARLLPFGESLPTKKSISRARYRIGPRPLMELFKAVARPWAVPESCPGAFYRGLRIMALDATVIDVPDTPENERIFGRRKTGRGKAAFPQVKVSALLETGTRMIVDLLVRPHRRHEQITGLQIIGRSVARGMIVLWDRGYHGFRTLKAVLDRGAHFLGRVPDYVILEPVRVLPDGSFWADVFPSAQARKSGRDALRVRVVQYRVAAPGGKKGERIRLVTSMLDPDAAPAPELAGMYHERWEIELVFDEIKTHQLGRPNGQRVAIRAQKPPAVVQEIYGWALAHRVVRVLMAAAAAREEIDPDRLSFKNSLVIVRAHLSRAASIPPGLLPFFYSASSLKSPTNVFRRAKNAAISAP